MRVYFFHFSYILGADEDDETSCTSNVESVVSDVFRGLRLLIFVGGLKF